MAGSLEPRKNHIQFLSAIELLSKDGVRVKARILGSAGWQNEQILEKINDLDPTHRQPVYLRFVEGLSPPEIGEVLGISSNTASVRVNRGLNELRKKTGYDDKNENNS
jgi:RNA polymerase sigma factor (sigma-70 family)